MSKASLIRLINTVYVQLWEVGRKDPDLLGEMRSSSQLERFSVPNLQFHLAMLRDLYPFQVEAVVVDVVKEVVKRTGTDSKQSLWLAYHVAPLWLGDMAEDEAIYFFIAHQFGVKFYSKLSLDRNVQAAIKRNTRRAIDRLGR